MANNRPQMRLRRLSSGFGVGLRVREFQLSDFGGFAKQVTSRQVWRDAWRSANDSFEWFMFEARKTAERLDRQYSVSQHLALKRD